MEGIIKERSEASNSEGDEAALHDFTNSNNNTSSLDEHTNIDQLESSEKAKHMVLLWPSSSAPKANNKEKWIWSAFGQAASPEKT